MWHWNTESVLKLSEKLEQTHLGQRNSSSQPKQNQQVTHKCTRCVRNLVEGTTEGTIICPFIRQNTSQFSPESELNPTE
jgi:hypothetical protein